MGLYGEAYSEFQKAFSIDNQFAEAKNEINVITNIMKQIKQNIENNVIN